VRQARVSDRGIDSFFNLKEGDAMKIKKTPEQRAEIIVRALSTGKMANTLAKALAIRYAYRWQFIDFRGPGGQESAGVVDILAIRKSGKQPHIEGLKPLDLFDIIIMQVKGGSAGKPKEDDISRLKLVRDEYRAQAIVLYEWNKRKGLSKFSTWDDEGAWINKTSKELFGRQKKSKKDASKAPPEVGKAPATKLDEPKTLDAVVSSKDNPVAKAPPKKSAGKKLSDLSNVPASMAPTAAGTLAAKKAWATRKAAGLVKSK